MEGGFLVLLASGGQVGNWFWLMSFPSAKAVFTWRLCPV